MTWRQILTILIAVLTVGLTACEKVTLVEEEEEEKVKQSTLPGIEPIEPRSVGLGTQYAPFTVEQVLKAENLNSILSWFVGYVVGSTYSTMDNAIFEAETSYESNILLSSDSMCTDREKCIPVELKTATLQKQFSLHYNSSQFRQCIVLQGRANQYFRVNGIRDVRQGYWLPHFSLKTINPDPANWEDRDFTY